MKKMMNKKPAKKTYRTFLTGLTMTDLQEAIDEETAAEIAPDYASYQLTK